MDSYLHINAYEYKVGGSLPPNALCYVARQADRDLVVALEAGEFCYVFNSRQMGKSSLKVRTMQLLEEKKIACAAVDVTRLGATQVTVEQWYKGLVAELVRAFKLSERFDLKAWRNERTELSAIQQLNFFIEDVLLVHIDSSRVCIFLEEIDNVKSLDFSTDDLFALIRACYEQRSHNPLYDRLAFCLLGVATPTDLIDNKQRTPFNIGRSIELSGFTLSEAESALTQGFAGVVDHPVAVLQEILGWTDGQPFLTQKICKLVAEACCRNPNIAQLVRQQILEHWESQDDPPHLRTIRDRILGSGLRRGRLLGLYRQILQEDSIALDDGPEQVELQLSGLVVKRQGRLHVYNRICAAVFDLAWVDRELMALRPDFYAIAFSGWLGSNGQDPSWLLRGQMLQQAQQWAGDRPMSDQDYRFLEASRQLEQRDLQLKLAAEAEAAKILTKANQTLTQANRKATRRIRIGGVVLGASVLVALGAGLWATHTLQKVQLAEIKSLTVASTAALNANQELDALLAALKAAIKLKSARQEDADMQGAVQLALQRVLFQISESNRLEGHTDSVRGVDFSPDGRLLATASDDSTVRLWSAEGREIQRLSGKNQFRSVRFSPDGQKIAAISANNTVMLWGIDGIKQMTFSGSAAEDNYMADLCFSPNGQVIAASGTDHTIKLLRIDGQAPKILTGHKQQVWSLSCHPDGQRIVAADQAGFVKLWGMNGRELKSFRTSHHSIFGISFSPNSQAIATVGGQIKLWQLDGKLVRNIGKSGGYGLGVRFSPDGRTIASVSKDKNARLWNLQGQLLQIFKGHQTPVLGLSFSPNGQTIATAGGDNSVRLWTLSNPNHQILIGHKAPLWSVSVSPDGTMIATAGDSVSGDAQIIQLWSQTGQPLQTIKAKSRDLKRIWSLSFSPNGQTIAAAGSDKTLKLWDLKGQLLKTFKGHGGEVIEVRFSPDARTLATASYDGTVRLWNIIDQSFKVLEANAGKVRSVDFSPDGRLLASAHNDGTIHLWNHSGQLLKVFQGHSNYITRVRFSPDGKTLASASADRTIKLWTLDGHELKTFAGHSTGITGLSFSPNGRTLASSSADGSLREWNISTGKESKIIMKQAHPFWNLSFTPDGKTLVSVSDRAKVELWNVKTIESLQQMIVQGCSWVSNYLKHNGRVDEGDRHLCDGIDQKALA